MLQGKILITGGSGYLGRAILRRARQEDWDAQFTIFSRDELKQAQCRRRYKDARYILGDVRDTERLALAMAGHDYVIHTAALKYVPEGERNVSECISVNVNGTQSVIRAARYAQVQRMVVISTDKAVDPRNVYGMTKGLCERLVGETANDEYNDTTITAVRYGNVIGSSGSVVPEFKRQAAECGVVNVTNVEMTRFWMTVDAAIDLIVLAARSEAGSITIEQPKAMSLGELVQAVAPNARLNVIGLRPGEKMHEVLLTRNESSFVWQDTPPFILPSISRRVSREGATFEISSAETWQMRQDEFLAAVEDSYFV